MNRKQKIELLMLIEQGNKEALKAAANAPIDWKNINPEEIVIYMNLGDGKLFRIGEFNLSGERRMMTEEEFRLATKNAHKLTLNL